MANFRISTAVRNALADQLRALLDLGPGPGTIEIRSGVQPASPDDPVTGTLLATLTFADPCAPAAVDGVLTFSPIIEDSAADATGTATWARILNGAGVAGVDVDIGVAGATLIINTVNIVAGGPVRISFFAITIPAG